MRWNANQIKLPLHKKEVPVCLSLSHKTNSLHLLLLILGLCLLFLISHLPWSRCHYLSTKARTAMFYEWRMNWWGRDPVAKGSSYLKKRRMPSTGRNDARTTRQPKGHGRRDGWTTTCWSLILWPWKKKMPGLVLNYWPSNSTSAWSTLQDTLLRATDCHIMCTAAHSPFLPPAPSTSSCRGTTTGPAETHL